jgi:cell division protein FtsQ
LRLADLTTSSKVPTQGNHRTRSLIWEDDAPAESRFRRVQQSVPASGRGLPGMPREMEDPDGSGPSARGRFGAPPRPWWRPAGTWGRAFFLFCALTVVALLAISYYVSKTFLERDARFRIAGTSNIQAGGLIEVSRAEILPVFGEDIGRNIFFVPLNERRKQLEQIPWVQHATVIRLLPDQIRVSVVERQPVAFVRHAQQIGLVDANGVLLNMPVAMLTQHHYSFPVLTGIDAGDPLPSRKARMDLYLRLMGELDANGQRLSEQISEIDLTDPEDARVLMPEQGTDILAHFGEDHFLDRYQRYRAHIAEWREQYPKLAAVDLRYDQQVVLEMKPGAPTEQAAVSTGDSKPAAGEPIKPAAHLPAAKSEAAKPLATKVDPPKTTESAKSAKAHALLNTPTDPKIKSERVNLLAAKMRDKKRAEATRAALRKTKQKPNVKNHHPVATGQGQ